MAGETERSSPTQGRLCWPFPSQALGVSWMSSSTQDWPDDAEGLARVARDSADQDARDRALRGLSSVVRLVARRIAQRFGHPLAADLAEEGLGEVWQALRGFRDGDSFEAWCYGVLRNHLVDRVRSHQRDRARQERAARLEAVADLRTALEGAEDEHTFFNAADLATLRQVPLPQRLALLSLAGLWGKVPVAEWGEWVGAYRSGVRAALPDPFPPSSLQECENLSERIGTLASALGVRRNTLSVWLYRHKQTLRGLQYLRERLGPQEG